MLKKIISFLLAFSMINIPAFTYENEEYLVQLANNYKITTPFNGVIESVPYAEGYYTVKSKKVLDILESQNLVLSVSPITNLKLLDYPKVNDVKLSSQWYLDNINAKSAFDNGFNGEGVKVGIVDSGITKSHEDFDYSKIYGKNFLFDGLSESNFSDTLGHGTLVTSILKATANNSVGIAGLVDEVTTVVARVFGKNTSGTNATLLSAINYLISEDVDVINMSLGMDTANSITGLKYALDAAKENGVIIIASAGNDGNSTLSFPASLSSVVGVGSIDVTNTVSDFSQHNESVFITAPGENIFGISNAGSKNYTTDSGTSFSAPIISALAVMAKQANKQITSDQFQTLLIRSSTDRGAKGYDTSYGYGTINVDKFIDELTKNYTINYNLNGGSLPDNSIKTFNINRTDDAVLPIPTKEGYNFDGFYDNPNFEGEVYTKVPSGTIDDLTLYAKFYEIGEYHFLSARQSQGGTILPSGITVAKYHDNQTFTITPDDGYQITSVLIDGVYVGNVSSYTLTDVSKDHTIDAKFSLIDYDVFDDISTNDWFYNSVINIYNKEIMKGVSYRKFGPELNATRAMIVTIIYRLDNQPNVIAFDDKWYSNAQQYAINFGISDGNNMEQNITREQLITILYRYFDDEIIYSQNNLNRFNDIHLIDDYAKSAFSWAISNGIINGDGNYIKPKSLATRAEISAIITRFLSIN